MSPLRPLLTLPNLARLLLCLVLATALYELKTTKPPWKTPWAKHQAEGSISPFGEHLATGLWRGAAVRAGICGVLLLISIGWKWGTDKKPAQPIAFNLRKPGDPDVSPRTFGLVLGVIVLAAFAERVPRMTHSFWGDEADVAATYIHGNFRPVKKGEPQGKLYFEQPTWLQTFFSARHGANNHALFSVCSRCCLNLWQAITKKPSTEFTEWIIRVPSLLAGLGSLVVTALLLRRWGWPLLGLVTALVMAGHPWHVRYSTEARGYGMMLLFLPWLLLLFTNALERDRWRDWLFVALGEFLLMNAWAGIAYALALLNVAVAVLILMRADRVHLFVRWLTANLLSAMAFISLYLPQLTQISEVRQRTLWSKGAPMDATWFHNVITQPFTAIPYHNLTPANPGEISWQRLFSQSPLITSIGFAVILAGCLLGLILLWRRSRPIAALVSSLLAAAVVCTLHFKYGLGDEMRAWYLIFTLPSLAICMALAWWSTADFVARSLPPSSATVVRSAVLLLLLTLAGASLWPTNASMVTQPEEDYKSAIAATTGRHEKFSPKGTSNVHTLWLWRYSALYDPRGDIHTRDDVGLRTLMENARNKHGELYVVVGYRSLAEWKSADILAVLDDPTQFEKTATFPTRESLHTLEVYHLKAP